jgi:acetyltransferase-like isoleucine patch superfamily enzyme
VLRKLRSLGYDAYLVAMRLLLRCPGHRFRLAVLRGLGRWEIGPNTSVERTGRFESKSGVTIGPDCNINRDVLLDGRGGVVIGSSVNISPGVTVLTADHDPHSASFEGRVRPVRIGSRVWIATDAIILPGTEIGDGALIGAGSVVSGLVAPDSIVAGNPARAVGERAAGAQSHLAPYRRFLH